ncbi:MAG TPA: hypothetical protein VGM30_00805 [Puia sp.]|jgi:hypothetical protein
MSPFLEQKELFDQVLRLGKGEQRDPYSVIERFFGDYRLHECRQYLWAMVETCLTTDNVEFNDPEERANLLLRYRELEKLVEAGYLLLLQRDPAGKGTLTGGREVGKIRVKRGEKGITGKKNGKKVGVEG